MRVHGSLIVLTAATMLCPIGVSVFRFAQAQESAMVDEEGFTVQEPLETALCANGRYALLQREEREEGGEEVAPLRFVLECDGSGAPVHRLYDVDDDPATPEVVEEEPARSCEHYALDTGCPAP